MQVPTSTTASYRTHLKKYQPLDPKDQSYIPWDPLSNIAKLKCHYLGFTKTKNKKQKQYVHPLETKLYFDKWIQYTKYFIKYFSLFILYNIFMILHNLTFLNSAKLFGTWGPSAPIVDLPSLPANKVLMTWILHHFSLHIFVFV